MKARAGSGWQYVMTDLSMILFMITAAAVNETPPSPARPVLAAKAPVAPPALGEPIAVWRSGPSAPDLRQWLAAQAADPRQRLTVIGSASQSAEALALAASAGRPARVLLESDGDGAPFATLTYDQGVDMARPLQPEGKALAAKEP